jgi:hypothetical protein
MKTSNLAGRTKASIFAGLVAGFLFSAPSSFGGTVTTCEKYQSVTVGSYIVQTDYWNPGQCPGTQCVSIDDQTGAYTVTKGDFQCPNPYTVAAYPSIVYGSAWGAHSPNCPLPAPLSGLKCVNSSWCFQPTDTGAWDAAYDIWLCPDNSCGPNGFKGGAEIMIWLDYRNTNGWKTDVGPVTLNGMTWEVWRWDVDDAGGQRNYVAYLAKTLTTCVKDLDLKAFLDDSRKRGYIQPSWYLYAVEVGNELRYGGIPFTSKSFSVSVNKDCGAKAVFTPLPTFTPSATPDLTPQVIPPPP